jgi:Nucleotidyltransferase
MSSAIRQALQGPNRVSMLFSEAGEVTAQFAHDARFDCSSRAVRLRSASGSSATSYLWFGAKFGEPYPPLFCTLRFPSATFAVSVRLEPDDRLHIEAPFGLGDLFALRLRPNPRRKTVHFARTAADVQRRWPELVIHEEPKGVC